MAETIQTVETRVKGQWVSVPSMAVNGELLVAKGKWPRIARVRGEEMRERDLEDPEVYLRALKGDTKQILNADIFSFTQMISATQPRYCYPMEWESVAAISLISYIGWWNGLPQESRKNVRRAEKRGVVIKLKQFDEDLIEGLREVNDDSPMRQGMKNAYYGLTASETRRRYCEFVGRCDFICAYFGDEMIGFLHLVHRGAVGAILNLTTKPSHFDKRPANALLAKAVEIAEARGMTHISYGLYNYGNKRNSSLKEFKVRNGFEEILAPRYYVPITLCGRLCIRAKLHRGLIGMLPPSVIAGALRARTLWYGSMNFKRRCSSMPERPNCDRQMGRSNPPAGSRFSRG